MGLEQNGKIYRGEGFHERQRKRGERAREKRRQIQGGVRERDGGGWERIKIGLEKERCLLTVVRGEKEGRVERKGQYFKNTDKLKSLHNHFITDTAVHSAVMGS